MGFRCGAAIEYAHSCAVAEYRMFSHNGLRLDDIPYDDLKLFVGRVAIKEVSVAQAQHTDDQLHRAAWARTTEEAPEGDIFFMVAFVLRDICHPLSIGLAPSRDDKDFGAFDCFTFYNKW